MRRRDLAHVAGYDAPRLPILARPDARVTVRAFDHHTGHLDDEPSAERGNGDVRANATDAKLFRLVAAKPDGARLVRL